MTLPHGAYAMTGLDTGRPLPSWVWLVLIGAMVVAFFVVEIWKGKRREKAFARIGAELGLHSLGQVQLSFGEEGETRFLKHRGSCHNVMAGTFGGMQVFLFDYWYSRGREIVSQTVAAFPLHLPSFELRRSHWERTLGTLFSSSRIRFPESPNFDGHYMVLGKEEIPVRAAFTPAVLDFFEHLDHTWDWCVESSGTCLLVYRESKPFTLLPQPPQELKPKRIPQFLQEAASIASAFKPT